MTQHRAARRPALLACAAAVVLAAAVATSGCGGGHHGWWDSGGTIEVENHWSSWWGIDEVEIEAFFGPTWHYEVFLAPGEADAFDVDDSEDYEIRLYWSNGDVDTFDRWVGNGDWVTVVGVN